MRKALILAAALLVLGGGALFYTVRAARVAAEGGPAAFDLARPGQIVVRDGRTGLVRGSRTRCERFATASGTGICLVTDVAKTYAVVVDRTMRETRRLHIAGIPSRARVSSSGRMISWTVFVTGDSYNTSGFSTWTGILDNRTGYAVTNMEQIPLIKDGRRYHSADVNYWGVTFAPDDNRFYATVSTRGKTYLVQGDYGKWEARVLRANAECPSLSPDGGRLVFKKRMPGGAWRLHALDLATMAETPLAEQADVDDQAAWLDGATVMYAKGGDVWAVPADGTGAPRLLVADASSPSAVR
ncbi:TolB family protein [Nonomuraea sp. NPDC003727]